MLGLYIHIPFCSAICNYCNFNRGLYEEGLKTRYVEAIVAEIRGKADGTPADTIFFGGGTPSLLTPDEIGRLIGECRAAFDLTDDAEVTLEANPETVSDDTLAGFLASGVNRLSYGVQSFRDEELARLSRLHSASRAEQAFRMARAAGFDNVSMDLMMWLPQQSVPEWLQSVEALIALEPDHASLYLLEIYPNAPLRDAMARAQWSVAPDDDAAEMYLGAMNRLESAGYEQYEISNVARPGRESRHNVKVLDRRRMVGLRMRRPFDPRRRSVEECVLHGGVHLESRWARTARGRAPGADSAGAPGGDFIHRSSPVEGCGSASNCRAFRS